MKLIKLLALVAVALLVSTSSYTVGEGSWECLWGTDCSSIGVTSTADCSGYTTAGSMCRDSDSGLLYIGNGTTAVPYQPETLSWRSIVAPVVAGNCFYADGMGTGNDQPCSIASTFYTGWSFSGTLYVHDCSVSFLSYSNWDANDVNIYTLQAIKISDSAVTDFAADFTQKDGAASCGSDTDCATGIGQVTWNVRESITVVDGAMLQLRTVSTVENGAASQLDWVVECQVNRIINP